LALIASLISISALTRLAAASDVVSVQPLTDRILMVHYDDGYVIHHKRDQPRSQETVVVDPLDTAAAAKPESYEITSPDDPAYAQAKHPTSIGRKSKGTDFAWFADKWVNGRAVNDRPRLQMRGVCRQEQAEPKDAEMRQLLTGHCIQLSAGKAN
jgi:hypothetical protein